jgi:hypothetical protein
MLPCDQKEEKSDVSISSYDYSKSYIDELYYETNNGKLYIDELSKVAKDEFDNILNPKINRQFLGKITLSCRFEDRGNKKFLGIQDAFITKTQYENTELCLLSIVIVDIQISITYLLDQASCRELLIIEEGQEKPLDDWIINKFGLKTNGKAFFTSFMSKLPDNENETRCIIATEGFNEESEFYIVSSTIEKCLKENKALYSRTDEYMSERGIICVLKEFYKSYKNRLDPECLSIFIIELVILKITAINMANQEVIKAYTKINESNIKDKNPSRAVLEILEGFAKSLPMWDRQHFNYFLAQEFAYRVETAFNVSSYLADYERNRTHLEQIVNTRKLIVSEKENKTITFFAKVLSFIQVLPISYSILSYVFGVQKIAGCGQIYAFFASPIVTLIGATVLWFIFRRKNQENS